jgi:mRNA degradation ribonuclease J1/J2
MIDFYGNVIKERVLLAEHGAIFVSVSYDKNGIKDINVRLIGIIASGQLYEEMKKCVITSVKNFFNERDIESIENNSNYCEQAVQRIIKSKIGKIPVVEVHTVNVDV